MEADSVKHGGSLAFLPTHGILLTRTVTSRYFATRMSLELAFSPAAHRETPRFCAHRRG